MCQLPCLLYQVFSSNVKKIDEAFNEMLQMFKNVISVGITNCGEKKNKAV